MRSRSGDPRLGGGGAGGVSEEPRGRPRARGRLAIAATAVVLLAGGTILFGPFGPPVPADEPETVRGRLASPPPGRAVAARSSRSVAVLPFRDLSREGDLSWLGHGLAEDILGALGRVPGLDVVARASSFTLADERIGTIGQELGATHVLSGSVRTDGDVATISAQFVSVDGEREVWARDFRPTLGQYSDARQQITRSVVAALEIELGEIESSRVIEQATTEPLAYEHYLRGLQFWDRRSEAAILRAVDHFRTAVDVDPRYAAAWAGLSYAYLVLPEYLTAADVAGVRAESRAAARRALDLDPDQPDALTAMGWGRLVQDYDWQAAEELIGRALQLEPTNVRALHWQSHVVSWQGRHEEAVALASRAAELDPLSPIMRQNLGYILMEAGRYEEALAQLEQVLVREPGYAISIRTGWNIETRRKRFAEAAQLLENWLVARGRDALAAGQLSEEFASQARSFAETGRVGRLSMQLLQRLDMGVEVAGQPHAAVGDGERTLAALEQAYRQRTGNRNLLGIRINPLYDFLRDDPRFQDVVERVGL